MLRKGDGNTMSISCSKLFNTFIHICFPEIPLSNSTANRAPINVLLPEGKRASRGSCTANLSPCEKQLLLLNGKDSM